jgi:aryl-phospho-beta-D-glucosidase BglC (GH1 family)
MAASAYKAINNYAQSFVNAVRATGGNNSQRNLVVCTYGACDGSGTWSQHLKEPLTEMKLPEDETEGHLIFEVHSYPDIKSLTTAKKEVRSLVSNLNKHLVTKGAPVIIGEWGSSTNGAYENYRNNYLAFARYFIEQTKASDIATFHWMGLSDEKHRTVPKFNQQDLVDAIVKGYYGETGYSSIDATETDDESVLDIYMLNGTKVLHGVTRKDAVKKLKRGLYFSQNKKVFIR